MFSGDDVYKKIKVLSGGEKSRVALAKTLISEANFLLLDEPTNHLDFQSENILIQALQQYEGSFVIVSHNRHFISKTANKIWYIEDQQIKEYPGTFDEYEYWLAQKGSNTKATPSVQKKKKGGNNTKLKNKNDSSEKLIKKLQGEIESIENKITALEGKVEESETELADPANYGNVDNLMKANDAFEKAKSELEKVNAEWEIKVTELEDLER